MDTDERRAQLGRIDSIFDLTSREVAVCLRCVDAYVRVTPELRKDRGGLVPYVDKIRLGCGDLAAQDIAVVHRDTYGR